MNPLANAGVSGAVVSLVVAYLQRHGIVLTPEVVASLVTLTYTGTHAAGAFVNALLARYAPGVEAVVQAVEPVMEPVDLSGRGWGAVMNAVASSIPAPQQAVVYASTKAAVGATQAS